MILKKFYFFTAKGVLPDKNSVGISLLFKLFFFLFFAQMILYVPILYLRDFEFIKNIKHPIILFLEKDASISNILGLGLLVGLVHPLMEELIFRYTLIITKINSCIIGIALFLSYIITVFFNFSAYLGFSMGIYAFSIQFIIFVIIFIPIITKILPRTIIYSIIEFVKSNSRILVFCSSLLFAIIHIGVSDKTDYFLLYIIILMPFFFAGYFYSFVRLWLGLRYSVLLHGTFNIVLFSIKLINYYILID